MRFKVFERLADLFQLFFPQTCEVCGESLRYSEHLLCTDCLNDIPQIYLHTADNNPVEKIFAGRIPFERATAFFNYQKHTKYAALVQKLKYNNRPDIGIWLGEIFGVELQNSGFLNGIDGIVPIPLHPRRERKRGYNQSQMLAQGIANITNLPILNHAVERTTYTETQTRKNKEERQKNIQGVFTITHPEMLKGKHVLILDDVITTGVTCLSCAETILKDSEVAHISFASIALAQH